MTEPRHEVRYRFELSRHARKSKTTTITSSPVIAALPRITSLMALAIKLAGLLRERPDLNVEELARRACVSRTRITQILNLTELGARYSGAALMSTSAREGS